MENASQPPQELTWTFEDYTERRCLLSEVGQVRYDDSYAKRLARQHTITAVLALANTAQQDDDLSARVKAAQALLDRGYGKPDQRVEQDTEVKITIAWASPDRLSYRDSPPAEVVEMAPAPAALPDQSWKEAPITNQTTMAQLMARERKGGES